MNESRRSFIRKSAIAGGVAWAAPAVVSLPKAMAEGTNGTPIEPPQCVCTGQGTALEGEVTLAPGTPLAHDVKIGPLGQSTGAQVCEARVDDTIVNATTLCGAFDSASCTSSASVQTLTVTVGGSELVDATVLASTVTVDDDDSDGCDNTSTSTIATLSVAGNPIANLNQPQTIPVPGVGTVFLNEEICDGNAVVRRALRIELAGVAAEGEIRVAESRATSTCCPCT